MTPNFRNELLQNLSAKLMPYSYNLVRRMDWFERREKVRSMFRLDFYGSQSRPSSYSVAPSLAIRINEVEDIFHRFSGFDLKYQRDTPTVWTALDKLLRNGKSFEYSLPTVAHIQLAEQKLFSVFMDHGRSFFQHNSSLVAVNQLLNSNPEEEDSIYCIPEHRYFRGVITAKLANDHTYKQISVEYHRQIKERLPHRIEAFKDLLFYLEHYNSKTLTESDV